MEKAFETVKEFALACIDYIEQNAVWLGIVGVAVLVLLVLFGFLGTARRSRKQIKMLRKIDKNLEAFAEGAERREASGTALAEDVAAIRAATDRPEEDAEDAEEDGAAYARTVESFFEDAEVEQCVANAPVENGDVSEEMMREDIEEMTEKLAAFTESEEQAALEPAANEESLKLEKLAKQEEPAQQEDVESAEAPMEEPAPLTDLQAALLAGRKGPQENSDSLMNNEAAPAADGPVAKGKSGRLYTREELENQIRK